MPWSTPSLIQIRILVRDDIVAAFSGSITIGNSVLRVMADAMAGLGHLTLRYVDWLARQFLPDTAETDWLARHGDIWLVNADGSLGRKNATFAVGTVTLTGINGTLVASGTELSSSKQVGYETTEQITIGVTATSVAVRAVDAGINGNLDAGETLDLVDIIGGVDSNATVLNLGGGIDEESDADLRARVLFRIQQPPMGGDASDYVVWATAVSGVTRAWAAPLEMGIGTMTIRFMMDDLRSSVGGFPLTSDIADVTTYIDSKRPVAIKDRWVLSSLPEPIDFIVTELSPDTVSIRSGIEVGVRAMLRAKAAPAHAINGVIQPAQTIYAAWVSEAISNVQGVNHFKLTMEDHEMPSKGHLGVLGTIVYG